jgi:hypothetical protein
MRWVSLPLIDGLSAQVRADQVVGIAPAAAFPDLCGPGAGDGSVVSVGNMLLRSTDTVGKVWGRIIEATV